MKTGRTVASGKNDHGWVSESDFSLFTLYFSPFQFALVLHIVTARARPVQR
jgi:hypothetical protein